MAWYLTVCQDSYGGGGEDGKVYVGGVETTMLCNNLYNNWKKW